MFVLMASGNVRAGQVIGATNNKAEEPAGDGFTPADLSASFLTNIGIDHTTELEANVGRPIMLVKNGTPIPGLLGG
jgi:hypothetical protein